MKILLAWNPRKSESLLDYKAQKEALDLGLAICKNMGINCIHLMVHCTGLVQLDLSDFRAFCCSLDLERTPLPQTPLLTKAYSDGP